MDTEDLTRKKKTNKKATEMFIIRAANTLMRKEMGHTAVSTIKVSSVTLKIWQHGDKENY